MYNTINSFNHLGCIHFIIDSLEFFTGISKFEISHDINVIDKNGNFIRKYSGRGGINVSICEHEKDYLKTIKKYCDKLNIKLVLNGSEYENGIPISTLIEQL